MNVPMNDPNNMKPICHDCPYWEVCEPPYDCYQTEAKYRSSTDETLSQQKERIAKMADKRQVMSWLEGLAQDDWPMYHSDSEMQEIAKAALALLKEQEPVKPIFIENPYTHLQVSYCSRCKEPIDKYIVGNPYKVTKFCHYCGKAVNWE